jgi:hypothetical protein
MKQPVSAKQIIVILIQNREKLKNSKSRTRVATDVTSIGTFSFA